MLIDWFTVIAQIVNFLILVWLLKRFLYRRIIRAIDQREKTIAGELAEARQNRAEAQEQLARYQAELNLLEQKREGMLAEARLEADRQGAAMLEKGRKYVRSLEERWQQDLDRDRQTFLLDLRRRTATEILTITRRIIADLTSVELEQCAIQVFLQKIRALNHDHWSRFAGADLQIRTAMNLGDDQRSQIVRTVEERIGAPVRLRFEQAPGMGLGLELRGNGWRIGWSSDSYLQALEDDLNEALSHGSGSEAAVAKVS
jgi:F-type H+-transporting ATPase subunit b